MIYGRDPIIQRATEFRQRQADALKELATETDPVLRQYLKARADQAGCEASASERFIEKGDWTL